MKSLTVVKMVKLNFDYVQKCRRKNKSEIINKSHMFMSNRQIDEIGNLTKLNYLTVIYLHNNSIKVIDNLAQMNNLTHLYLEWNSIERIDNFNNLPNLRNLYLGFNYIAALEGLNGMPNLKVLHLQRQKLMESGSYRFNLDTLTELSHSLIELNLSGNNVTSLEELKTLNELIYLDVSNNLISNLGELINAVQIWKKLKFLQIKGNPVMKNAKCEYDIIASSSALETLNDKPVSLKTRVFLQSFKNMKLKHEKRKQSEQRVAFSSETRSFVRQLPPEFREIVSQSMILNKRQ